MNDLKVCSWAIDKPIPYAGNSRKIPERPIDKVAASIKEFKADERTKILALSSGTLLVYQVPDAVALDGLKFTMKTGVCR